MEPGNQVCGVIGVVDDEPSVRKALARLLSAEGFGTATFSSGEELLAAIGRMRLDCLLVDVKMSPMSGIEVCRRLAAGGSTVPVVLISAHADDDVRTRSWSHGARALLQKPISEETLMNVLREALRS
jgi:two-component system response regulator FixJ